MRGASLLLIVGLSSAGARADTLAVSPPRLNAGARAELPVFFEEFLLAAAHGVSGCDVIGEQDFEALLDLEAQRRLLDCDDWCITDLIGGLGIDKQLAITVVRLDGGTWLTVGKVLDAKAKRVEAIDSALVAGDARDLLRVLERLIGEILTAPAPAEVVRPSPFFVRLQSRPRAAGGNQCDAGDPKDCEEQCLRRHAGSCQTLATNYLMGRSTPAVWGRSVIFFEQACELGSASACNNLGALHHFGLGVEIDEQRARSLYELACAAGDATGCEHLGGLLSRREPLP